jgi:hypothetical protein
MEPLPALQKLRGRSFDLHVLRLLLRAHREPLRRRSSRLPVDDHYLI